MKTTKKEKGKWILIYDQQKNNFFTQKKKTKSNKQRSKKQTNKQNNLNIRGNILSKSSIVLILSKLKCKSASQTK